MLITFLIEFAFGLYVIWKYKKSTIKQLVIATLFALGTFQLAEYLLCGGLGLSNIDWARIGYVSITLLPALGIHMIVTLANKKAPIIVGAAYASAAAFVFYYIFGANAVTHQACYSNYAVFANHENSGLYFGVYYYLWMIIGIWLAWIWGKQMPERKKSLNAMTLGYVAFILPTTFFNIIDPKTVHGIPSIMCGFAVLLAFSLVLKVLPLSAESKNPVRDFSGTADSRL